MDRVGNKIGALRFSPTQPSATLNSPPPLFQLTSNHEEGWGLHSTQNPVSASGHWPSIWILIRLWPQIMEEISKAGRACVVQISVPLCCKQCWRAIHLKCLTLFTVKILKRLPILGQWSQLMVQCKFYSVFKGRFHRISLFNLPIAIVQLDHLEEFSYALQKQQFYSNLKWTKQVQKTWRCLTLLKCDGTWI